MPASSVTERDNHLERLHVLYRCLILVEKVTEEHFALSHALAYCTKLVEYLL